MLPIIGNPPKREKRRPENFELDIALAVWPGVLAEDDPTEAAPCKTDFRFVSSDMRNPWEDEKCRIENFQPDLSLVAWPGLAQNEPIGTVPCKTDFPIVFLVMGNPQKRQKCRLQKFDLDPPTVTRVGALRLNCTVKQRHLLPNFLYGQFFLISDWLLLTDRQTSFEVCQDSRFQLRE